MRERFYACCKRNMSERTTATSARAATATAAPNLVELSAAISRLRETTTGTGYEPDVILIANAFAWLAEYFDVLRAPPSNQCVGLKTLASLPLKVLATPLFAKDSYVRYTEAAANLLRENTSQQLLDGASFANMMRNFKEFSDLISRANPNNFQGEVGKNIAEILRMVGDTEKFARDLATEMSRLKDENSRLQTELNLTAGKVFSAENRADEAEKKLLSLIAVLNQTR